MEEIKIKALIDAGESAKTIGELKKALRDLKSASLGVAEGSKAFDQITSAAGELQDKIGDLNARTKNLGSDLKNLEGFMSIGEGIAGAFSAMQGAAALFGGENKQLEESLLRVQSAMGILQGIQAVANVLQKESSAMLLVNNALRKISAMFTKEQAVASAADATAKEAEAIATTEAAVAQQGLNTAMKANPILALIGLITAAVAVLWAFTTGSKEAEEAQKALNDEIKKSKEATELEIKTFEGAIKALKEMKTGSEERAIAIDKINKQYGTTLQNYKDEKEFLKQINDQVKDYISGAKDRLKIKINEARAENYLNLMNAKRYEMQKKQKDLNLIINKQQAAQNANNLILAEQMRQQAQAIQAEINTLDKVALGYEAKADKVLEANGKLLAQETEQEKKERLKRDKDAADAEAKKIADQKKAAAAATKTKADAAKAEAAKIYEATKAYAEAQAKTIASIEKYIQTVHDDTTKKYISDWSSVYIDKIALLDANLKVEVQKYKDEYAKLNDTIKEEFEKSPTYIRFKTSSEGITDPAKLAKAYNDALNTYVDITPGLRAKINDATSAMNSAISTATTNTARESAKIWADEMKKAADRVKEVSKVVLATEEYKRFYEFLQIKNEELTAGMLKSVEARKLTIKEEIELRKKETAALQKEIDERTKLNETAGEYATIENMRKKLNETTDPTERESIQDAIDQTEDLNDTTKFFIDTKKVEIEQLEKENKRIEDIIKSQNELNKSKDEQKNWPDAEFTQRNKPSFDQELTSFSKLLEQTTTGAETQIQDFGTEIDLLSGKIKTSAQEYQDIIENNPYYEMGGYAEELAGNIEKAEAKLKAMNVTQAKFAAYLLRVGEGDSIIVTAQDSIDALFALDREYNKGLLSSATQTNIQLAAIYKDKNDIIVEQEQDINKNINTLFNDAQATATANGDKNVLDLLNTLKKADGTFKQFAVSVTDEANQFGLDIFGTLFTDRLDGMNEALSKRYDTIIETENQSYEKALFNQFKQLEKGEITQEQYNKNTENIETNHQENLLVIDVSYGKKKQVDLVTFYKDRKKTAEEAAADERAQRIKDLEALFALERTMQQAIYDEYTNNLDKRSQEVDSQLQDELDAIDKRKAAYEEAASEMTAEEKANKMALDAFDLERKDAEEAAAAEQQALDYKRFEADRTNKSISVGLEYILAIAKAWGTLGPFGAPMAAFLGIQAGIAEAAIWSQEYVPAFAEGGYVTGPGGPKEDKINAKLSNGESVINAKSTKMYAPLLSAINVAGGGKAFPMAAGGQVTPAMVQQQEAQQYDMGRLEYILEKYASRPIETYVKESSITSAQKDASKINRRTRF